jgi:hypothetical protein
MCGIISVAIGHDSRAEHGDGSAPKLPDKRLCRAA